MNPQTKVITRMAPSPTGKFHVGGVRTALFNYLFARQHEGEFIIRSEDTDQERSRPEYEQDMLEVFKWLGIEHDAFYRQSERIEVYQKHIARLIEGGHAYEAEDSTENPDKKVIRFINPNKQITFNDIILGEISFDTTELGDFVIARNLDTPLYHLTVVVDDGCMGVTHIIRGQEHVNNTARQILIMEALKFSRPQYAHLPLIMSPRGGKLSKRDPEVIPAIEYRNHGIVRDALINFLAFIGWNPGDDTEVMNLSELIENFDITKVQKGGGVFNIEKLYWLNKQYLQKMSDEEFISYLEPKMNDIKSITGFNMNMFKKILIIIRERVETFHDVDAMIQAGDLNYYFTTPEYSRDELVWKDSNLQEAQEHLQHIYTTLDNYQGEWNTEAIKTELFPYADKEGRGNVLWPLRFSLSGKKKSPDPFTLLSLLGKEESLRRIKAAL